MVRLTSISRLFAGGSFARARRQPNGVAFDPRPPPCAATQTIEAYLRDRVLPALNRARQGSELLTEFVKRWENHQIMNKWMRLFFMYLVRGSWPASLVQGRRGEMRG